MIRTKSTIVALALVATAGSAFAVDYDPTGQAGRFDSLRPAMLIGGAGGSFGASRVYVPVILDEDDGLFNSPAVQNNAALNNTPFGAWTTFSSTAGSPPIKVVGAFGTTDASNPGGGSNDVFLTEGAITASNTIGQLVRDGTLVYRANFNSAVPQNDLEVRTIMWPMNTPGAAITASNPGVFGAFPGIDGIPGGSVFLSTPGAERFATDLYTGNTNFNGGTAAVANAVNVYKNLGNDPLAPVALWLQDNCPLPTLPGPTPDLGEIRQTAPTLQTVTLPNGTQALYTTFGVGFSEAGSGTPYSSGSARPIYFIVDEVNAGSFGDGFAFIDADGDNDLNIANPGLRFIDHQATGGGSSPFVGRQFDMNSRGQIAALYEDRSLPLRVYEVRLFNPIFSAAGDRIVGYSAPITVARSGQDGIVEELQTIGGTPAGPIFLVPFSGVSIDDAGRVASSPSPRRSRSRRPPCPASSACRTPPTMSWSGSPAPVRSTASCRAARTATSSPATTVCNSRSACSPSIRPPTASPAPDSPIAAATSSSRSATTPTRPASTATPTASSIRADPCAPASPPRPRSAASPS